jgi:hypothetical protein
LIRSARVSASHRGSNENDDRQDSHRVGVARNRLGGGKAQVSEPNFVAGRWMRQAGPPQSPACAAAD